MKHIAQGRGRREERQKEAVERNAAWRELSTRDRSIIIDARLTTFGGQAKRERARLAAEIGAVSANG